MTLGSETWNAETGKHKRKFRFVETSILFTRHMNVTFIWFKFLHRNFEMCLIILWDFLCTIYRVSVISNLLASLLPNVSILLEYSGSELCLGEDKDWTVIYGYNFRPVCLLYFHYVRYIVCLEMFMVSFVFLSSYNLKCQFLCRANREDSADRLVQRQKQPYFLLSQLSSNI
jgi:hypothetical protein